MMTKRMKVVKVDGEIKLVDLFGREELMQEINKYLDDIEDTLAKRDKTIKEQKAQLEKPTDEKLTEALAKIKSLEQKIEKLYRESLYLLSEEDRKKSHEFWKEHRKECPGKARSMEWVVTGTGIGDALEYRCKHCGATLDLTDVSRW